MGKWRDKTLGDLIESRSANLQTGPFGTMLNSSEYSVSGVPVIAVQDIGNNKLLHDKFVYVNDKVAERLSRYKVQENDIIFGRKGAIERRALIRKDEAGWLQGSDCIRLRFDEAINPRFISYQFGTNSHKEWMSQFASGATMPSLNQEILKLLPVKLPPLPEQKAIASVLSSLDDKIDLLHHQDKTLEAMAETLFRQWFVEEAQEDWEEVPLGDIAIVQNGYAFSSRDYVEYQPDHLEVFKMGHIEPGGGLRYSPKTDFVPRAVKLEKWILSEGDIVMAMTDMKDSMGILGHPAMIDKSDTYVLNQRVARIYLNCNEILINNHFLYLQLKTDVAISIIQSKAHGGVQVNLSTEAIRSTPIIVPPKQDQKKGFKLLEGYLLKSQNNRKKIQTLEKLRDTLLPKLMSGEVRVKYET